MTTCENIETILYIFGMIAFAIFMHWLIDKMEGDYHDDWWQ